MTAHARLSASSAHRWLQCPGSVAAADSAPRQPAGFAAKEGNAAHELAELALRDGKFSCNYLIGEVLPDNNAFTVTYEMARYVNEYLSLLHSIGGEQWYERRVDFSAWVPNGFGTSDCIAYKDGTLYVVDFKYGKGLQIDAYENPQGLLYALGAYAEMEFTHNIERVEIIISQPRRDSVTDWKISVTELLKHGEKIAPRAQLAASDNAPRQPEEKACHWCPAKAMCPELLKLSHDVIAKDFDDLPCADHLTDTQIANVLTHKRLIMGWLDAVEDFAREKAESPQGFPGFKLVSGRGSRDWANYEQAQLELEKVIGDAAFERKLLSVPKAEKLLSKDQRESLEELVVKREGAPTLVPNSDPRPSIKANASDFDSF